MPDNLTASEVENLVKNEGLAFDIVIGLSKTGCRPRKIDIDILMDVVTALPALLRAWEEQQPWRNAAAAAEACLAEEMEKNRVLLARAETAEHEREVMRRALDAARAEVADLKRERDDAIAAALVANAKEGTP